MNKEFSDKVMEERGNALAKRRAEATKGHWDSDCVIHESFNGYVVGFTDALKLVEFYTEALESINKRINEGLENQ